MGVWEPPLIATIGGGQTAYIAEDPATDEMFSLYKRWLERCVQGDKICNTDKASTLPLRLIDVGERQRDGTYPAPLLEHRDRSKG